MRDKRKSKEYFDAYLEYQYSRIQAKTEKLKGCDKEKKQRILLSLTGYETDLLKAEFSAGAAKEELKTLLLQAMKNATDYHDVSCEDLLLLLSLAVMLDAEKDAKKLVHVHEKVLGADRLLNCISSYIDSGKVLWDTHIPLAGTYSLLDKVVKASRKEEAMLKYLESWYEKHADCAWYGSHLGDMDTYCGYWSFESAAMAKILGIKSSKLTGSEYFPVL